MSRIRDLRHGLAAARRMQQELDRIKLQLGSIESRAVGALPRDAGVREAEFSVFSQFGEDGIIQFLVQRVSIEHDVFVEFGVEDYTESNTRFLLSHDNWRGLILDGGSAHVEFVERSGLAWRHHLDARSAFVDRDNINALIGGGGISGDIGLLSIDIDGNDYWVLEAIDVVSPRILVAEYNSNFGPDSAVTIPYDPSFRRAEAHYSHLYWGASLTALSELAARKGYALVGGNSAGNNAFFVRRDVLGDLRELPPREAYAVSRFRESRGPRGELTYVGEPRARLDLIKHLPLVDVSSNRLGTVADLYGLG
jgi:hypothetical protein